MFARFPSVLAGRRSSRLVALALGLGAVACGDDGPMGNGGGDDLPNPLSNAVILDRTGTLPPIALNPTGDTFSVALPAGRALGLIFESEAPLAASTRVPGGLIYSPGGTFAAIVPLSPGRVFIRLQHGDWSNEDVELDYRLRVVAVRETPEQAGEEIRGGALVTEWVDPPLDIDEFAIELAQGDRFYIEASSDAGEEVTVRLETPGGAMAVPIFATGPELAASAVLEAGSTGEYLVGVSAAGLAPDVAAKYRFRVVRVPDAE